MKTLLRLLLSFVSLAGAANVRADEPYVSYIFPAGGQRGTTVPVKVGGHYLHDAAAFEMFGEGVTASAVVRKAPRTVWFEGPVIPQPASQRKEDYPKDYDGEIAIAANAALGVRRWRVSTSQGVTASRAFVVGEVPEIVEDEIDGDPIPVAIELPVTINGRIFPREDVDVWTFEAHMNESIVCEVTAARIGSPLDSRLEIYGPDGQLAAENTDTNGSDSFINFVAPADGVYRVRIYDVNFGGLQDYVYRLTVRSGPYVAHVYPLGGRRGQRVDFRLYGAALASDRTTLDLPTEGEDMFVHRVEAGGRESNPFFLQLSDLPEFVEAGADAATTEQPVVQPPAVLNGIVGHPGEIDTWQIEAKKGEEWLLEVFAARLGSHLDAVLTIRDADGKQLAQADDLSQGQTDAQLRFKVPADGIYTVEVSDRFTSRGGLRFAYRLHVKSPPRPDFQLELPADALTVLRGGEVKMKITAERLGGFAGAIQLQIENLPAGVTVSGDTIAEKKNDTQLVLKAEETAKIQTSRLKIFGTASIDDATIRRQAQLPTMSPLDTPIDHLALAVAMPTPFKVTGVFETKFAARGSTLVRHYSIERGGFEGPITVSLADRQVRHLQGVTGPTIVVPPGQSEFDYPAQLAPWMELGRTSRACVMAVGVVKEPDGTPHTVSYTSQEQADQIIALVDPGQLAVRVVPASLLAENGTEAELAVEIGRGKGIAGPVEIQLVVPDHIRGVHAPPVTIAAGQSSGRLRLRFDGESLGPFNMPLTVRATAHAGAYPYLAEDKVDVRLAALR